MMGLIERQRDNTRNARHRPRCNLFALVSINHTHLGHSGKGHENSWPRLLDLDATGAGIRLNISYMFIGARIDNSQRSCPGI